MSRLISELKEPSNLKDIELLGATAHLEAMDIVNTEFEKLRQEKVDEETQREYAQVYQVFRELSGDLKDYIKYLALVNKNNYRADELPKILGNIEMEITEAMAAASSRETRKANRKPAA